MRTIGLDDFHSSTRRLPHWRATNVVYFVTWRLAPLQPGLSPEERTVVRDAILHFDGNRYECGAGVVMDDHVHVLVHPIAPHRLETIVHSWKSYTANRLQRDHHRVGVVWQEEAYDRIVRDEAEFLEKLAYIVGNPGKRWPELEWYEWVWPRDE